MDDLVEPMELHTFFLHRKESGLLFWRERSECLFTDAYGNAKRACKCWNRRYANERAFTSINSSGYHAGTLLNRRYLAHRVVWAMEYGSWPDSFIDHINRDKTDNRIENLRLASNSENMMNTDAYSSNKSGYKGVSFKPSKGKWVAQIGFRNTKKHIGYFDTPQEASKAYQEVSKQMHGSYSPFSRDIGGLK